MSSVGGFSLSVLEDPVLFFFLFLSFGDLAIVLIFVCAVSNWFDLNFMANCGEFWARMSERKIGVDSWSIFVFVVCF